jgi:hypothetical protein
MVFKGKIVSDATDIEGVLIKNISSKQETYSYRGGYFSINGKQNDTLMFSAFNLKATMHIIKDKDFGDNLIFIPMPLNRTELKELAIIEEKKSQLEKKRDEFVAQLWECMNKNPTEHIIEASVDTPTEDKKLVKPKVEKPKGIELDHTKALMASAVSYENLKDIFKEAWVSCLKEQQIPLKAAYDDFKANWEI